KAMANHPNWLRRRVGRAWVRHQENLKAELDYAEAHWNDPELQTTAKRMKEAFEAQRKLETELGYDIEDREFYLPQRYDAALWSGKSILFQEMKILGRKFAEEATFP